MSTPPLHVLETCLYVDDLEAAREFYVRVLGAKDFSGQAGSHVFLRLGGSLLFLFRPDASEVPTPPEKGLAIPTHGARGPGHVAFAIAPADFDFWKGRLEEEGVPIERRIDWPNGARSLYFRDPGGNSLELAERTLWADVLSD
ncbi:MAG: VOC family protein [Opitutales bacterium]